MQSFSSQMISFADGPAMRMDSVSGIMTLASLGRMASEQKLADERKPRRALTSYNLFFQEERRRLLAEHKASKGSKNGKLGFAGLARHIAAKWKKLSKAEKEPFEHLAAQDKQRYISEKECWEESQKSGSITECSHDYSTEDSFNASLMSMLGQTPHTPFSPQSSLPLTVSNPQQSTSGPLELINDFLLENHEDDFSPLDLNPIHDVSSSPIDAFSFDISPNEVFVPTQSNNHPLSWQYLQEQMGMDCVDELTQCFRR